MTVQPGRRDILSVGVSFFLSLLWLLSQPHSVRAQHIRPEGVQIYVQSDTLKLDVQIDTLFSKRMLDAVGTGMTASILVQFRILSEPQTRLRQHATFSRLEHDIWEGQYRVIRFTSPPDTLDTERFEVVRAYCSDLEGISLGALPLPNRPLSLQYHIEVNPISPEQQRRTRRWLNLLQRWSLLEFFIQLNRSSAGTGWVELLRFTPAGLPHIRTAQTDSLSHSDPERQK